VNLGVILTERKQFDKVAQVYRRYIDIAPENMEAYLNLGSVLQVQGKHAGAEIMFMRVLAVDQMNLSAHQGLAASLRAQNKISEAISCFQKILKIDAKQADAHLAIGEMQQAGNNFTDAIYNFEQALTIDPRSARAWNNKGLALQFQKKANQAVECYRQALAIDPQFVSAHNNLGNTFQDLARFQDAIASYRQTLRIDPNNSDAYNNLGSAYEAMKDYDQALDHYQQALKIAPTQTNALLNIGSIYQREMRLDEAKTYFDAALAIDANYVDALWNRAIVSLLSGNFAEGWRGYEYRWTRRNAPPKPEFNQPFWSGDADLSDKTILLYSEQGVGDTIQFVRYIDRILALGADIVLAVQPALKTLFTPSPRVNVITQIDSNLPPFDFQCPLASLPLAFKTDLTNIPAANSCLAVAPDRIRYWADKFSDYALPRIGIVWSGNPTHANDHNRSMRLETLSALWKRTDCGFFSLQKEVREIDIQTMRDATAIVDLSSDMSDYTETAAIIANLDLVISVDTSVAHLAGAMGAKVWVLLPFSPDFRWLTERSDSPWYPSMRLFRQPAIDDWTSVLDEVVSSLDSMQH
ncbi:MAG TPA: tetratricopeptide repeat protein, partial [Burkholderiaceae bacterium]|nr:tetratricopeptide repeat protein [Burkholderiaceae bacterium]